jgi:hypothetical protein
MKIFFPRIEVRFYKAACLALDISSEVFQYASPTFLQVWGIYEGESNENLRRVKSRPYSVQL